ncbi:hypothetical protein QWY75_12900 [Pontixanthobacter aestiaquae]|uniref:Uncharacterized protein n=1 Tax=Pontixanthobacter aestiaquae TaxID=1509367 RepID=A0A844YZM0_9SPHN|nr:hypothetical protein [Pontixanthobacter aestiaquae]MDN3647103.1 hypothetical protein [Pontixanthobacter aestiaquae]MXO81921.1 hypothetical protein [Pontixanthobacter aestiaquae]
MRDIFTASTQYNDFKGTVAADRSDGELISDYLNSKGLSGENERVVGWRLIFSENSGQEISHPGLVVYLAPAEENPSRIRAVELQLSNAEWFKYFKRFDLVMTVNGSDFSGIEIDGPHYG